jgi:hypothetical protein
MKLQCQVLSGRGNPKFQTSHTELNLSFKTGIFQRGKSESIKSKIKKEKF